jgi:hypothetical protein
MAIAKSARNDGEKKAEVGNARRHTPCILEEAYLHLAKFFSGILYDPHKPHDF